MYCQLKFFGANFSYSWGPVAWLLAAEIFSPGHRSQAVSIIISCNYMMNFVVGQVTPNMLDKLKFGTYIFFGAFCLLMFLWVLLLVPETRYKTLEEMDMVFGDNSGQVDQERMREIMSEVGLEQHGPGRVASIGAVTEKDIKAEHVRDDADNWKEHA